MMKKAIKAIAEVHQAFRESGDTSDAADDKMFAEAVFVTQKILKQLTPAQVEYFVRIVLPYVWRDYVSRQESVVKP